MMSLRRRPVGRNPARKRIGSSKVTTREAAVSVPATTIRTSNTILSTSLRIIPQAHRAKLASMPDESKTPRQPPVFQVLGAGLVVGGIIGLLAGNIALGAVVGFLFAGPVYIVAQRIGGGPDA